MPCEPSVVDIDMPGLENTDSEIASWFGASSKTIERRKVQVTHNFDIQAAVCGSQTEIEESAIDIEAIR